MIRDINKLEPQQNPTDLRELITYDMFKILTSKIHANYDAKAVLRDIKKTVVMDADAMLDFLIRNTPADKVKAKKILRKKGFVRPFAIQLDATDLYDLQHMSKKESVFQQMVKLIKE